MIPSTPSHGLLWRLEKTNRYSIWNIDSVKVSSLALTVLGGEASQVGKTGQVMEVVVQKLQEAREFPKRGFLSLPLFPCSLHSGNLESSLKGNADQI